MDIFFLNYFIVSLVILISLKDCLRIVPFCPPAEEGKDYTLSFTLTHPSDQYINVAIVREEIAVASCSSASVCTNYLSFFYKATSFRNETKSEITIYVTSYNMTRTNLATTHTDWYVSLDAKDIGS
ncbi:unnamed protein product, partial [Lymnaea stagnalis]